MSETSDLRLSDARRGRRRASTRGQTLIEGLFAASMAVAGLFMISTSLGRSNAAGLAVQQEMIATATLSKAAGSLRAHGVTASFLSYRPNGKGAPFPADGSGPGPHIVAPGLCDAADPNHPAEVSIRFFTDETADLPEFGLPRDLDGDGAATNADTARIASDGRLMATTLPYALTLRFREAGCGARTVTWNGVLTNVR